jgi:hypothetical protein
VVEIAGAKRQAKRDLILTVFIIVGKEEEFLTSIIGSLFFLRDCDEVLSHSPLDGSEANTSNHSNVISILQLSRGNGLLTNYIPVYQQKVADSVSETAN